jgi:hypothetical protein
MTSTKRATRIEEPSIELTFRTASRDIVRQDIWREDVMEWQPGGGGDMIQFYLVLDFGYEEQITDKRDDDGEPVFQRTGRIVLSLQPVEFDPDTWSLDSAVGLGPAVTRFADIDTDAIGDKASEAGEAPLVGRPLVGWTRHPVSTRREGN